MGKQTLALALVTLFSVAQCASSDRYRLSELYGNAKTGEAFNTGGAQGFMKIYTWTSPAGYLAALQQVRQFGTKYDKEGKKDEEGPAYGVTAQATKKEITFGPGDSLVVIGCVDNIGVKKIEFLINGKDANRPSLCSGDEKPFKSENNVVGLRGTYATYVEPVSKSTISMITSIGFVYSTPTFKLSLSQTDAMLSETVHGEYEGRKFLQGSSDGIKHITLFKDPNPNTRIIYGIQVTRAFNKKEETTTIGTVSGIPLTPEKIDVGDNDITQMAGCTTKKTGGLGQLLAVTKLTFGLNKSPPAKPACLPDVEDSFWSYRVGMFTGFRGYTQTSDNMAEHIGAIGFFYENKN